MSLASADITALLETVRSTQDRQSAIKLVQQIDALKLALESVERFREESIKYAILEAEALIRVVELKGIDSLKAPHKKTAQWLSSLSADERSTFISKCTDGITIDEIFKRDVAPKMKLENKIDELQEGEKRLINTLEKVGVVNLNSYSSWVSGVLYGVPQITQNDIIDGARKRLRQHGAVGIGHDSGIYVLPQRASREEVVSAVLLRYKSIAADIAALKRLTMVSNIRPTHGEVKLSATSQYIHTDDYFDDAELIDFMVTAGVFSPPMEV